MEELLLTGKYNLKSMKPVDLSNTDKEELQAYFENAFEINESLFTGLKDPSVFYKCPDRLRLPLIFYYAHTATVYVNKLMIAGLIKERVNMEFETLCETGVDEMSWDDTENYRMGGSFKWPSIEEITEYRRTVRNLVLKVINDTPLVLPINQDNPWWALLMGIEHERIHIETSSVLIRQLPVELVQIPRDWKYAPHSSGDAVTKNSMIHVSGCDVTMGKPVDFPSFGWDNEYPEFNTKVPSFEASKYLITNGEFYKFVKEGGYNKKEYWTDEGWKWKEFRQANHPTFWVCTKVCKGGCGGVISEYSHCRPEVFYTNGESDPIINGSNGIHNGNSNGVTNGVSNGVNNGSEEYKYRAIFSVIDMPWDWPVDVNYHEARAYCAWKGPEYRVPTEAEHHALMGKQVPSSIGVKADYAFSDDVKSNINLVYGSSTPVNMYPPSDKGIYDVSGNVWEWVADNFNGLPGSMTHYLYDDFSSPCYDGNHTMMQGGSWVSTGDEASRYARFSFRRHFFQHLGFRLVKSINEDDTLPLRLINTPVFVLGQGVPKITPSVNSPNIDKCYYPSTNTQYYEDEEQCLNDIIELQFGVKDDNYTTQLLHVCNTIIWKYNINKKSVVHFGCGPGRLAFELTRIFDEVLAVYFGGRYIDAAKKLQTTGSLMYETPGIDEIGNKRSKTSRDVKIPDDIDRQKVVFKQMTWIPNELHGYDLTIQDMTDRVMNVKAWLVRLWEITVPSGVVAIVSSTGWDKDKIEPIIGHRLGFLESMGFAYVNENGDRKDAIITLWKRR